MKRRSCFIFIVFLLLAGFVALKIILPEPEIVEPVALEEAGTEVAHFTEIPFDFEHEYAKGTLAFNGGALIDVDGNGVQEVFVGGGRGQADRLFEYHESGFRSIQNSGLSNKDEATFGAFSIDIDRDKDVDLFVSRENGVTLYINNGGTFLGQLLDIVLPENSSPMAVTGGDPDRDGDIDLYVSTFIDAEHFRPATFNDPEHAKANVYLRNRGDNTFEDATEAVGIDAEQNTFLSTFVDLNNDQWLDLVVAENTGQLLVFENRQNGTFAKHILTDYGFWMGLAIEDVDNDGDLDLFATNTGNTIPQRVINGDSTANQTVTGDWKLLVNEGAMQFVDATAELGLDGYEFAWGAQFLDANLDGRADLSVMQNYIKWPPHNLKKAPGRFFLQEESGTFVSATGILGLDNQYYGMTPLVSDFNRDGYPDMIYLNLDGPARAFMNDGGRRHWLTLVFDETVDAIGARAIVVKKDRSILMKQVVPTLGLYADSANELTFGLGNDEEIDEVQIFWPNGEVSNIGDLSVDTRVRVSQ